MPTHVPNQYSIRLDDSRKLGVEHMPLWRRAKDDQRHVNDLQPVSENNLPLKGMRYLTFLILIDRMVGSATQEGMPVRLNLRSQEYG
jgi:hypothetical protein